ncbi:MAG: PIN domain-containing protein [Bacteroidales bacterium]|nr:PIN domain-containing protein [Bacteroidales bacterium]
MKARIFLDTNIMLDLLGERYPYYEAVAKIASLADRGKISIYVSALSYATVNYFLTKYEDQKTARTKLRKFKVLSEISNLDASILERSLSSDFADFEDAIQYHCALKSKCSIILSRNQKDFKLSQIPVMSAEEYLVSLKDR